MLHESYVSQFNDENLIERFASKSNLPILVKLIQREQKKLKIIRNAKKDYGPRISLNESKNIFNEVKNLVDLILEEKRTPAPSIGYDNPFHILSNPYFIAYSSFLIGANILYYHRTGSIFYELSIPLLIWGYLSIYLTRTSMYEIQKNRVLLIERRKPNLVPAMAHEYAHHVLRTHGLLTNETRILSEGVARRIESMVASIYANVYSNPAFLEQITCYNLREYKNALNYIIKETGNQDLSIMASAIFGKTSVYDIGNALFSIYEEKMGPKIYADILKGKFEFPSN